MAELTVTGTAAGGEMPSVTVNGERAATGRSVASPAQISVPAQTNATVSFGKAGRIELSPNTTINLTFALTSISGNLSEGRARVVASPDTVVNIQTADAAIVTDANQTNVFLIEIVGGVTGVTTEVGQVKLNGSTLAAGESRTADPSKKAANQQTTADAATINPSLLLILLGAAGAVGIIAAVAAGGGGNDSAPVSPNR